MIMCATCAMAVQLPSMSYNSYVSKAASEVSYSSSVGTTFVNQATVGAYTGSCNPDSWQSDMNSCKTCCEGELDQCAASCAGNPNPTCMQGCFTQNQECHANCENPELGMPLDTSLYFLLALVAAYGAVAVYRRKTNVTAA